MNNNARSSRSHVFLDVLSERKIKIFKLALLLTASPLCWAVEISVHGISMSIPEPEGYGAVTEEMAFLFEFQKQFVAPTNEEFVSFIPQNGLASALNGEIPDLTRRFAVQTAKSFADRTVSTADFEILKQTIKTQNSEVLEKVLTKVPDLIGEVNKRIKEGYDVDLAFSVSQMVPMPVHEESQRTLAYSSLIKYDTTDEEGTSVPYVSAVTATFVHVRGKVLFLYAYAEESGLEWSKHASSGWVNNVVTSNPSDLETARREMPPPLTLD